MGATAAPVVGFGALSVDEIVYVDAPLQSGKGRILSRARAFGGNVATALVAVAKLGGTAKFIGFLNDSADDPAVLDLQANGVDIRHAPRAADCRPIQSLIAVGSDGDRFIAYDDEVRLGVAPDLPDDVLTSAGVLVVDGYAIHSLAVLQRARAFGVPVVTDIEWSAGQATDQLLQICDHLVLPLDFACHQTGFRNISEVLAALWSGARTAVVLTDGPQGVYVLADGVGPLHLPAHTVDVVDTTGAGDCFHGAYAHALARRLPVPDCVRFAAAAAALSVGGRGGREALPALRDVEQLLGATDAPRFRDLSSR